MFDWLFGKKKFIKVSGDTLEETVKEMEKSIKRECGNCSSCKKCPDPPTGYMVSRYECSYLGLPVKKLDKCKFHTYNKTTIKNFKQRKLAAQVYLESQFISKEQ